MNASNSGWMAEVTFMSGSKRTADLTLERWYVFIADDHAKELVDQHFSTSPNKHPCAKMYCADGRARTLCSVSTHEANVIMHADDEFSRKAIVFVQKGTAAPKERKHGRSLL